MLVFHVLIKLLLSLSKKNTCIVLTLVLINSTLNCSVKVNGLIFAILGTFKQILFIRKTVSDQEAHAMTEHLPFGVGDPEYDDGAEHFDEGFQLTFGADDNEQ